MISTIHNLLLKRKRGRGKGEEKKRVFIVESFCGTRIRIRILSTLKLCDKGDMVGLIFV